ncbi:MAG: CaiB/BaiF CoA-transferase family protein [Parvibaculaceae bacterium]|nr:CaiB/BaiF CoA-transferase family protein [Parvibaculaceae bacterium]HBM86979.1 CoA transferase [Rhodobiaceae bacterium]
MGKGPLSGVKIVEFAGIGPGPFCGMLLSDMGADVVRIDRKGGGGGSKFEVGARGRRSVAMDLKNPEAVEACLKLIEEADMLQEGFRPGVMERLGLGPDVCLKRNPKLVYGRMTGWGQYGPLAQAAGHDINYISLTGALHAIGRPGEKPVPPLNLVGDFGGGALYLALGMVSALTSARTTGKGQVVDCAMTDGSASLMSMFFGFTASGMWQPEKGTNMLDGGAHFYDTYETSDGKYISIGSIEPQFYALLREKAGLTEDLWDAQMDRAKWPEMKAEVEAVFKTKTRDEWSKLMEGTDICFAPVLGLDEAMDHPHNKERQTIVEIDGVQQPNVAPRFSGTPSEIQGPPPSVGAHNEEALSDWGFTSSDIDALKSSGAI